MKNSASGPTIDGVADAGRLEIGFGARGGRAGIAAIELPGRRSTTLQKRTQHRRRAERIDVDGVEVRLQDHVAFVDRLPAGDRASVEHEAVGQHVLVDHARGHGQMLPLALGVGEAEVDPVDLLILDARKDGACVVRHVSSLPLSIFRLCPKQMPLVRRRRAEDDAIRAWDFRFPDRPPEVRRAANISLGDRLFEPAGAYGAQVRRRRGTAHVDRAARAACACDPGLHRSSSFKAAIERRATPNVRSGRSRRGRRISSIRSASARSRRPRPGSSSASWSPTD